jgi:putative transposase
MARKPRIEFPGAFYHTMVRGNHKANIFRDDEDREKFLNRLLLYKERYDFLLYAYTLMPNHFHLLLETKETPLSKIMQGFLQSHTQWFNRKYKTVGHLFQGRYRAILCDKTPYLLSLVRYLHINCVRAGIVKDPEKYRWSSHRIYLGIESSALVDTDLVLSQFSANKKEAIRTYKSFVKETIRDKSNINLLTVTDQRFLGDETFIAQIKKEISEPLLGKDIIIRNKPLNEIASAIKKLTGFGISDLISRERGRKTTEARILFIHLALSYSNCRRKDIAAFLNRSPKMVSYLEKKMSCAEARNLGKKIQW